MDKMLQLAALSTGGVLGVNARYWLGFYVNRWVGPEFPWATLLINTTGSFAIGLLTMLLSRWLPHPNFRLLVVTGFLGGYTTYSTFALESLTLWERGARGLSLIYMASTVAAGFLAVILGVAVGREMTMRLGRGLERAVGHPFSRPVPAFGPLGRGESLPKAALRPSPSSKPGFLMLPSRDPDREQD